MQHANEHQGWPLPFLAYTYCILKTPYVCVYICDLMGYSKQVRASVLELQFSKLVARLQCLCIQVRPTVDVFSSTYGLVLLISEVPADTIK